MTDIGASQRQQEADRSGPAAATEVAVALYGASRPQPSAVGPLPAGGLAVAEYPPDVWPSAPAIWWAGCHGGAGVTTLIAASGCGRDSQRHWPVMRSGAGSKVVLVARTHESGLRATQAAARQWASGTLPPQISLVGLVLVADAPGRLPRQLRDLARLVAGGVPRTWQVGWHEELRLGPPASPTTGPAAADYRRLASSLTSIITGGPDA